MLSYLAEWAHNEFYDDTLVSDIVNFVKHVLSKDYNYYETLVPQKGEYSGKVNVLSTFSSAIGDTNIPYLVKPRQQGIDLTLTNAEWNITEDLSCKSKHLSPMNITQEECQAECDQNSLCFDFKYTEISDRTYKKCQNKLVYRLVYTKIKKVMAPVAKTNQSWTKNVY